MSTWAIVPVKPLRRGKSRLASVLSETERTELNTGMLKRTIKVLRHVSDITTILVVSKDHNALSIARDMGARTIQEEAAPHLNIALHRATAVARAYSTQSVLILPADLPLVQPEDIHDLLQHAKDPPVVVVSPDRHESGTNGLVVNPTGILPYSFGVNSFQKHCQDAEALGARLEICRIPSIGLDLDLPEDLELLRSLEVDLTDKYTLTHKPIWRN